MVDLQKNDFHGDVKLTAINPVADIANQHKKLSSHNPKNPDILWIPNVFPAVTLSIAVAPESRVTQRFVELIVSSSHPLMSQDSD